MKAESRKNTMTLSIIIPSYRRAKYLKNLISIIQPMVKGLRRQVEVVVIIDPSEDESPSVMVGSGFRYLVNSRRIGLNESIIKGVRESIGKFIWILGDDDVVCPGGIKLVLDSIKEMKRFSGTDIFMIVATDGDKDFSEVGRIWSWRYSDYIRMALRYRPSLLVEDLTISSRIFHRSNFSADTSREFEETQFGHYYAVSHMLFRHGGSILLDTSGEIFKRLPQRDRPLWVDFPTNLDRLYVDYLRFLESKSGIKIDPDLVLSEGRQAFRKSPRNPIKFLINNHRAVFNIRAWKYAFHRLFNRNKP